jgi:hypothetical protein
VVELFKRYPFTEQMLLTVSQEVLNSAAWGVIWRVCTGATLSILDMGSDINVCILYFTTEGQKGYGLSLLAMVLGNILLQSLLVVVNNMKRPGKILSELLIVLTGLKPAVDAYRCVRGGGGRATQCRSKHEIPTP